MGSMSKWVLVLSFGEDTEAKLRVQCYIEGFPSGDLSSDADFVVTDGDKNAFSTAWALASLSDSSAHVCKEKGGMKLLCGPHIIDKIGSEDWLTEGYGQWCTGR